MILRQAAKPDRKAYHRSTCCVVQQIAVLDIEEQQRSSFNGHNLAKVSKAQFVAIVPVSTGHTLFCECSGCRQVAGYASKLVSAPKFADPA